MKNIRETRSARGWRWARQVMLLILAVGVIQIIIGLGSGATSVAVKGVMGIVLVLPLFGGIAFVLGWLTGSGRT